MLRRQLNILKEVIEVPSLQFYCTEVILKSASLVTYLRACKTAQWVKTLATQVT